MLVRLPLMERDVLLLTTIPILRNFILLLINPFPLAIASLFETFPLSGMGTHRIQYLSEPLPLTDVNRGKPPSPWKHSFLLHLLPGREIPLPQNKN